MHASGDPKMKVAFSPTSRKHALIAVAALLIPMIPSFLLFPLGLSLTMGQFICGVLAALLCTAMIGARTAFAMSAVLTVAPISVAFTLAGALWGVVVGTVVMRSRHRAKIPVTPVHAAVALGVIPTILVISQPALGATWRKAIERLIGTAIGVFIAFVVSLVVPHGWVDLLIALVFLALVAHVKLDSSVLTTEVSRVTCTVIGAAIAMGIVVVLHWYSQLKPVNQAVLA